jgi:hypothetical protein
MDWGGVYLVEWHLGAFLWRLTAACFCRPSGLNGCRAAAPIAALAGLVMLPPSGSSLAVPQ